MPAVDRNVLRLGVFEMLYADDVPDAVAVTEAMALVRDLSTDESPPFVNGVLGTIQRNKSTLGLNRGTGRDEEASPTGPDAWDASRPQRLAGPRGPRGAAWPSGWCTW